MSTPNKELITDYFAVISGESDKPFNDFFSPGVVWHLPPGHPYGARFDGLENVLAMMGQGIGLFEQGSIRVTLLCLIAEGEDVIAQFTLDARMADGQDYCNQYMFRFRFENGQIAEVWEYLDTLYASNKGLF